MPIYEYVCRDCGERFERLVHGNATPSCPACEGARLDKQFSVFAVGARPTAASRPAPAACGTCGDPRGPGACSLN
jgi:putative FmdB family regulatory protein